MLCPWRMRSRQWRCSRPVTCLSAGEAGSDVFTQGIKMAAVMMTMLPIMCFYPFLQKYFVKGVLVGSIKM